MFGFIAKLFAGPIIEQVGGLVTKVFGNKEKRDDAVSSEQGKVLDQFAAEFHHGAGRTWFDSLIDGLNRLPRPLLFGYCFTMLMWPLFEPESFSIAMNSYTIMPEWLVQFIFGVTAVYVGGRILTKDFKMGGPSSKMVKQMLDNQKALHEAFASGKPQEGQEEALSEQPVVAGDPYEEVPGRLSNGELEASLKSSKPMSLPALVEYNRRLQEGTLGNKR